MRRRCLVPLVAVLLAAAGCSPSSSAGHGTPTPSRAAPSSGRPTSTPNSTAATSSSPGRTSASSAPGGLAQRVLAGMSEAQRVGQLLMVDCPSTGVGAATVTAIRSYLVGSVILDGTSRLSSGQTASIVAQLQGAAPAHTGLLVATDQEGGQVQRLRGPGFSSIPDAVQQGFLAPAALRSDAQLWGSQLRTAGVNVDLGPVLDTVPPNFGSNPPIGDLDREYGHDPATVNAHGNAVAQGLKAAGIDATAKHFPGLGRVHGNTDVSTGVLDTVTTRHDAYLAPFATAVDNGVPFVMVSTAIYTRIDRNRPAAFSPTIVTGMLRDDLGFQGVIISDDLGSAKQVSGYSPGDRAVAFVAAGGDIVLTVDATQAPEMTSALLSRAQSSPKFKAQVDAAALVVLQAKQARGLLH